MKRIIDFVRHPRAAVIAHDFCMVLIAWFASVWLIQSTSTNELSAMSSLFIVLVLQGSVFWATGLYKGLWRFASFQDMWNIVRACTFGTIAIVAALGILQGPAIVKWMPAVLGGGQAICVLLWLGVGLAVPALVATGRLAPLADPDQAAPLFLLGLVPQLLAGLGFLPGEELRPVREFSGGWRMRLNLARALMCRSDLLLLDEPTNHLDIATIRWLEDRIYSYPGAVLFITHDRAFLKRLATRIVEIDRGKLTSWPGDYDKYLIRKDKRLEDEAAADARFDKKLEQEEAWVRQGIKARRTRNEGRVRSLERMRAERESSQR